MTSLNQFSAIAGTASDAQTFTVLGFGLSTTITATPPTGFEISSNGTSYGSSLSLPTNGGTVFVRIPSTATSGSSPSGNISLASSPALSQTVAVSGAVTAANSPAVSCSPTSLTGFSTYAGSVSPAQTITVSGTNLTAPVSVTAAAGYEVSSDNTVFGSSVSLSQSGGILTNTPVYVRVAATASAGSLSGTAVSVASTGSPIVSVAGSGTVLTPSLSLVLNPNPVNEGASSTGTISIPQARVADLSVSLSSANTNAVAVTDTVTISAGATSATFQANAVNNPSSYAEASSSITASATGVTSASATLTVNNSTPASILPILLNGSGTSNTITQDFNGLGTNAVTGVIPASNGVIVSLGDVTSSNLNGWYAAKNSGSGTAATSISTNTNSSTGTLYNFGASGGSERALGAIATGTTAMTFGALLTNSSAGTITNIRISVKGEFWRSSTSTSNVLTFGYGTVDGTTVTTSNFLTATNGVGGVSGLNLVGPAPVASNGALDGTLAANQTNLTSVNVPLVLLAGQNGFIRWQDVNDAGDDAGLAIDDFVLTYDVDTSLGLSSFSPGSGAVGTTVTISGANFTNGIPVRFNGTAATEVTVSNSTTLTAKVPSGASTGYLSVGSGAEAVTNNSLAFVVGSFSASLTGGNSFGTATVGENSTKDLIANGGGLPGTNLAVSIDSADFQVASANIDAGYTSAFSASASILAPGGAVDYFNADYFVFRFSPNTPGSKTGTATVTSGGVPVARFILTGTATGIAQPNFSYGVGQNGQALLVWTSTATFSDLVLLGREGSSVTGSPGASEVVNGASTNFPTAGVTSNGASVLFTGDSSTTTLTITGLTNNRFYHFRMFNRQGGFVSSGSYLRVMPYADLSSRITQWNFNNSDLTPNVGAGTAAAVGGVTPGYVNGISGSSDRAATNKSVSVKGASGQNTGLQFAVSTAGKKDIKAYWDINASGSAPKHTRFQYTLDVTATTPVWVDYSPATSDSPGVTPDGGLYPVDGGDSTLLQRSADLTGISGVENNPKFGFRVITANAPGTNAMARADGTSAAYSTAGTIKYDMVTVTGVEGTFGTPLSNYIESFGLSGDSALGTADPDGDGMDNNAEFAFGTSPVSGGSRAATMSTTAGSIKLSWLQRSGVTYTVKSLPDLNTAFDSGSTVDQSPSSDQTSLPSADYQRYEATLSTGGSRGFLRVRAVAP